MTACTVAGDSAGSNGGGVFNSGMVTLNDTIVAGSTGGDIVSTGALTGGYDLVEDGSGSGLTHTLAGDPRLGPLGFYGGPTETVPLLPGSPALGAGIPMPGLTTDQRGLLRGNTVDIGAFQSSLVVESPAGTMNTTAAGLTLPGAVGLANQFPGTAISFDPAAFAGGSTIALAGAPLELSDTALATTIAGPSAGVRIDAGGLSGVFLVDGGVTAALSGLTITGGSALLGGGLKNIGTTTLTDCTISGNSANVGGGLSSYGTATLTDCTISGNSANFGGGVSAHGPLTLTACTVSGNSAAIAGGGVFLPSGQYSRTTIGDTIVAGNTASNAPDFAGAVSTDLGYNLIGDGDGASGFTAAGDQVGTATSPIDPRLAPLGDYGGPTQTMALRTRSPAIGKGVALPGITTDQRGFALDSPQLDIGAFQSNPLVVNTTSDGTGSLPGDLDLRQAVNLANVIGAATTMTFDPTIFAAPQTIRLTAGQLELSDAGGLETITGPAAGLTIDAGGKSRVFVVDDGVTAALSGLTITGGSISSGFGGGLENLGTVTLTDCTVSGNSTSLGFGGGLENLGTATLTDCTISGNFASLGLGGGLANDGTATLVDCTINGNSAAHGGGVYNNATATLTDCTISGNSAFFGGGLWDYGTATLTDCTISGNSAKEGGGVAVFDLEPFIVLTLTACTVSGNSASTEGGGIDLYDGIAVGAVTISDTIVAGNHAGTGPDVSGTMTDDRGFPT